VASREKREVHTGFWWKELRERYHVEGLGTEEVIV